MFALDWDCASCSQYILIYYGKPYCHKTKTQHLLTGNWKMIKFLCIAFMNKSNDNENYPTLKGRGIMLHLHQRAFQNYHHCICYFKNHSTSSSVKTWNGQYISNIKIFTSLVRENRSGLHYFNTKPTKVIFHLVNPHRSNRTLPPPKKKKEKKKRKEKTNNNKNQNKTSFNLKL